MKIDIRRILMVMSATQRGVCTTTTTTTTCVCMRVLPAHECWPATHCPPVARGAVAVAVIVLRIHYCGTHTRKRFKPNPCPARCTFYANAGVTIIIIDIDIAIIIIIIAAYWCDSSMRIYALINVGTLPRVCVPEPGLIASDGRVSRTRRTHA